VLELNRDNYVGGMLLGERDKLGGGGVAAAWYVIASALPVHVPAQDGESERRVVDGDRGSEAAKCGGGGEPTAAAAGCEAGEAHGGRAARWDGRRGRPTRPATGRSGAAGWCVWLLLRALSATSATRPRVRPGGWACAVRPPAQHTQCHSTAQHTQLCWRVQWLLCAVRCAPRVVVVALAAQQATRPPRAPAGAVQSAAMALGVLQ
jgi:hypothetical protein